MKRETPIDDEIIDRLADAALGLDEVADEALDVDDLDEAADRALDSIENHRYKLTRYERLQARGARIAQKKAWNQIAIIQDVLNVRRRKIFLTELARCGVVGTAAAAAGLSPATFQSLRKADKDFSERWDRALEFAADVVEHEMFIRAVVGRERKVFQNGLHVDTITERSDRLLEMLAKARKPQKFRDNVKVETDFKGGVLVVPGIASSEAAWELQASANQAKYRENQGDQED